MTQPSPRERISINDHWRFIKGDPPGEGASLLYDIRSYEAKDDDPSSRL